MATPSSQHNKGSGSDAAISNAEAELLQAVLVSDVYPWTVEARDRYADEADAAGQALEISDEEAAQGWQSLSAQLDQLWSSESLDQGTAQQSALQQSALQQSALYQTFAGRLPVDLLARIAGKAQEVSASGESMINQMVACAQAVLSGIADSDLQVMARPMAMAMRGRSSDEIIEVTIRSIRVAEWEALSPIEKAKLSLAAARYAIAEAEEKK